MYAYEISYSPCISQKLSVWKAIKETILEPRLACSNLDYKKYASSCSKRACNNRTRSA